MDVEEVPGITLCIRKYLLTRGFAGANVVVPTDAGGAARRSRQQEEPGSRLGMPNVVPPPRPAAAEGRNGSTRRRSRERRHRKRGATPGDEKATCPPAARPVGKRVIEAKGNTGAHGRRGIPTEPEGPAALGRGVQPEPGARGLRPFSRGPRAWGPRAADAHGRAVGGPAAGGLR